MPAKKPTGPKSQPRSKPRAATKATPKPKAKAPRAKAADQAAPAGANPVLERGDLFFFYRPDVDEESPTGLNDIRRFHMVLRPEGKETLRLITVGRKMLPDAVEEGRSFWAFVERVFSSADDLREMLTGATYTTETAGERHLPQARAAGEGVYALVRHGRNSIMAYALELPEELGEVQRAFHIERQARFVVSVKNPQGGSPSGLGLDEGQQAEFPEELMERFGSRRWTAADPPEFLDYEGAELVLIGGREAGEEFEIELEPQPEDEDEAEVFQVLHLDKSDRTTRPLFDGTWE